MNTNLPPSSPWPRRHVDSAEPFVAAIRVGAPLSPEWSGWFQGLSVEQGPDGTTTLTGPVTDQPMLFGLLARCRDLGLPLLALECRPPS